MFLTTLQLSQRKQFCRDNIVLSKTHPFTAVTVAALQFDQSKGRASQETLVIEFRRKSVLFLLNMNIYNIGDYAGSDDANNLHLLDIILPVDALQLWAEKQKGWSRNIQIVPVPPTSFQLRLNDNK